MLLGFLLVPPGIVAALVWATTFNNKATIRTMIYGTVLWGAIMLCGALSH